MLGRAGHSELYAIRPGVVVLDMGRRVGESRLQHKRGEVVVNALAPAFSSIVVVFASSAAVDVEDCRRADGERVLARHAEQQLVLRKLDGVVGRAVRDTVCADAEVRIGLVPSSTRYELVGFVLFVFKHDERRRAAAFELDDVPDDVLHVQRDAAEVLLRRTSRVVLQHLPDNERLHRVVRVVP